MDPANRHFAEIMRQVEAGSLVIAAAAEAWTRLLFRAKNDNMRSTHWSRQ